MLDTGNDRAEKARRLMDVERDCDDFTHETIRLPNSTFVTPFDREDIYRLAGGLDDVMDDMEAAADYIHLYEIENLPPGVPDQVEVLRHAADLTAAVMPRLRIMRDLEEYWIETTGQRNSATTSTARLANPFSGTYDTLTVIRLRDVVEQLEAAIDSFEKVANIVEQIAVKESWHHGSHSCWPR